MSVDFGSLFDFVFDFLFDFVFDFLFDFLRRRRRDGPAAELRPLCQPLAGGWHSGVADHSATLILGALSSGMTMEAKDEGQVFLR